METRPVPPAALAGYILGREGGDEELALYESQGVDIRDAILGYLGPDWAWPGKRVLDFGCGAGRVLRQLIPDAADAELHGCDIDEACIAWLEANLSPPLHVRRSAADPPLDYPDGHFDFIYSTSVFSHLADNASAWLLELRRLLAPGGRLLVSVMGGAFSEAIASEPWDPDRIGMTVLGYARPWHAGGPMVLHSSWWVKAHWGRAFDVLALDEAGICGQDGVLLRPNDRAALTPADIDASEPGEPRELLAALHEIELLHAEHTALNNSHDAYAEAYTREAEQRAATEALLERVQAELAAARARVTALQRRSPRVLAGKVWRRLRPQ